MRRFVSLLMFCILFSGLVFSQTSTTEQSTVTPEPYTDDEFSSWQKDLRRAEIIAFGSLPFVTFMTTLSYDIYRYIDHGQRDEYLPWPMSKKEIAVPFSEDEQKRVLLISVGISLGVALIDFGYRTLKRKIQHSKQDRRNREAQQSRIIIEEIDLPSDELPDVSDADN